MATSIRLTIRAHGATIEGDGSAADESGFIECIALRDAVATDQAPTGRSMGRRHYEPIVVRKPVDRASPLLLQALSQNDTVEASIRFFDGEADAPFFTIDVPAGRIVTIAHAWESGTAAFEDVSIAPAAVVWSHADGASFESRPRSQI